MRIPALVWASSVTIECSRLEIPVLARVGSLTTAGYGLARENSLPSRVITNEEA